MQMQMIAALLWR